jgi:N-ethylmaleimide reductase
MSVTLQWGDAVERSRCCLVFIALAIYSGTLIYAGEYTAEKALTALDAGWADLIGVGRAFIANPIFPLRWQRGLPLNTPEAATFFGGGAKGLTDYPLAQA